MNLVDTNDAAKMLAISPWTLRAWEREGLINAVRLGGAVRYELSELQRFVERCKKGNSQRAVTAKAR
jgi:excisionase family DNA binding protein